jgi:hypothetical protein
MRWSLICLMLTGCSVLGEFKSTSNMYPKQTAWSTGRDRRDQCRADRELCAKYPVSSVCQDLGARCDLTPSY